MYRLLIADDEENIRNGMAKLISSFNLPIEVIAKAENGEVALSKIKQYQPEIVMVDINMPKLSGLELIREIRKFDEFCEIIIVSGYDRFEYAQKAMDHDVRGYMLKPIDDQDLYDCLKKSIDHYQKNMSHPKKEVKPTEDVSGLEIVNYVKANFLSSQMSLEHLMNYFSLSRSSLYKIFKSITNYGVSEYITFLKIEHAKRLLTTTTLSMKEISFELGYSDQHYFSRIFKQMTQCSPSEYKDHL